MKLLVKPIDAVNEQAFVESLDLKKFAKESKEKYNEMTSNQMEIQMQSNNVLLNESTVESTQQQIDVNSSQNQTNESNIEVMEIQKSNEVNNESEAVPQIDESSEESDDESEEILNYVRITVVLHLI